MLIPVYLRSFEKEVEKAKKRGLDLAALKEVMKKVNRRNAFRTKA